MADDIYQQEIDRNKEPNVSQFGEFDEQTKTEIQDLVDQARGYRDQARTAQTETGKLAEQVKAAQKDVNDKAESVRVNSEQANKLLDEAKALTLSAVYRTVKAQVTSGQYTIKPKDGTIFELDLMQPLTTLDAPPYDETAGMGRVLTILLRQGTGANKVSWPGTIKWSQGREPSLSIPAGRVDYVTLLTTDGGKSYYGIFNGGWF